MSAIISDTPWAKEVREGKLPGVKCVMASIHGDALEERPSAAEVVKGSLDMKGSGSIEFPLCREHMDSYYPALK